MDELGPDVGNDDEVGAASVGAGGVYTGGLGRTGGSGSEESREVIRGPVMTKITTVMIRKGSRDVFFAGWPIAGVGHGPCW